MLTARFIDVYHSLVFFYQVYRNWIEVSQGYLVNKMVVAGMEAAQAKKVVQKFMQYFGWQYSTKLIADYESCTVSEAYELSTIECLNILSYLKAKTDFDNEQIKKIR